MNLLNSSLSVQTITTFRFKYQDRLKFLSSSVFWLNLSFIALYQEGKLHIVIVFGIKYLHLSFTFTFV